MFTIRSLIVILLAMFTLRSLIVSMTLIVIIISIIFAQPKIVSNASVSLKSMNLLILWKKHGFDFSLPNNMSLQIVYKNNCLEDQSLLMFVQTRKIPLQTVHPPFARLP